MIVDSSALVAILLLEPTAPSLLAALAAAPSRAVSAATLVEASIVMQLKKGPIGLRELDDLVARYGIEIVPVDLEQVRLAREGFARFGKGVDRAGLNFGDLFAYALARARGRPLLYLGNDFARTDVASALGPG